MTKKIPVNLLTGFLGSGKTTLLKDLLRENNGRKKIAILMNEIGEVSIDAKLLEGFSVDMFELNDGCICCSVNEDFVTALDELAEKLSPDLMVIETTGVANPMNIIYSLLNPMLVLDAVITTVDAKHFLRMQSDIDVALEQIEAADALLITKDDLATEAELSEVRTWIQAHNPHAAPFLRREARLDLVFGVAYPRAPIDMSLPHHRHHHLDGIETFRIQENWTFDLSALQSILDKLPSTVWRVKGVIHLAAHSESFILNFAFGRHTLEDYAGASDTRCDLIVIGNGIASERRNLTALFHTAILR